MGPDAVPNIQNLVSAASGNRQVLDTDFLEEANYVFSTAIDPRAEEKVGAFVTIQKAVITSAPSVLFRQHVAARYLAPQMKSLPRFVLGGHWCWRNHPHWSEQPTPMVKACW